MQRSLHAVGRLVSGRVRPTVWRSDCARENSRCLNPSGGGLTIRPVLPRSLRSARPECEEQVPMKVALLTGGGDCPGLNAVIRAVVRTIENAGGETYGFLEGWRGAI